MKTNSKKDMNDVDKIKQFLMDLGFECNSFPSAQNLIYAKDGETIIIKNNMKSKSQEVDMR